MATSVILLPWLGLMANPLCQSPMSLSIWPSPAQSYFLNTLSFGFRVTFSLLSLLWNISAPLLTVSVLSYGN